MLLKIPFPPPWFQCRGEKTPASSLLAAWDFLPCVTVGVIAMSHLEDFMWVDGWSSSRKRTVVKIPINEGRRNMTWSASGPYLAMAGACRLKLYPISPWLWVSAQCQCWQITLSSRWIPARALEPSCSHSLPANEFTAYGEKWSPALL